MENHGIVFLNFCGKPDRGFQKDFIFIFAPRSCEKPQCIFIFLGKSLFSLICILARSKRNDSFIYHLL